MIVIETNKTATRQWCKDTFGNASIVYTGNANTLPECIHAADVNQPNTKIVLPSNDNNGAIPSSYLANNDKCLTQDSILRLYQKITINPTFYITKTSTGATLPTYKATLNITYYNEVKVNAVYPGLYGITGNNMPTVTVDISRYNKDSIILTTPLASTTLSGITLPLATQLTSSSFVDGNVFANSYNTLITKPTGSMDYTTFFQSYIGDMYKYFNGETSDAKYKITASITPSAYIRTSSIFAPIYYNLTNVSVIANTSTSDGNVAKANITYNCTSETIENTYNVYAFIIKVLNKNAGTSSDLVTVSSDKGSLSISSNTGTTTQTILGTVRYQKTTSNDLPPFITIKYAPSGYTPYYITYIANLKSTA